MRCLHLVAPILLGSWLVAQGEPRPAARILRDFDRVAMPSMSEGSDAESVRRFKAAIDAGCRRQGELAAELQRGHPAHPRLPEMLSMRWAGMTNALGQADAVAADVAALLRQESLRDDVKREARRARARALVVSPSFTNLERLDAVRELLDCEPEDEFAPVALLDLVEQHIVDPETQRSLLGIAMKRWPDSAYGGKPAKRWLGLIDRIGKSFAGELPAEQREWFAKQTEADVEFTVVQVWMGWVGKDGADGKDAEIEALKQLRADLGDHVRVLGLMAGQLDERLPEARAAGVDWPQRECATTGEMQTPFDAPRIGFHFLLDRRLHVVGVAGRAATLRERIAQVRADAKAPERRER